MKKIFTLCFFALTLLFSTQGIDAQNIKEINAAASEKAKAVGQTVKIHKDQLEDVYQAYKVYETSFQGLSKDLEANREELKIINIALDNRLKEILNDEQFEKYMATYRAN
ncbi:hypothetical protein [Psychroserpens sp.]|uniref:hypothetical protein n=1 Tax=Psychroserpens sp. TaxID=2020870 RepID=UPI00385F8F10